MLRIKDYLSGIICLMVIGISTCVYAADDDKNQPLYLQADSVSLDNKTGESQYVGHVTVQQGSSYLTADRATVHTDKDHKIQEAIAYGTPLNQAHYRTQSDPEKPEMNAYADVIKIYPQEHWVYLIGHAKVTQGADSYKAPEIEYNSMTQRVFSKKSAAGRTQIVIHPDDNKSGDKL